MLALAAGLSVGCVHRPAAYERPDLIARINGEGAEAIEAAAEARDKIPLPLTRKAEGADDAVLRVSDERAGPAAEAATASRIGESELPKEGQAGSEALAEELTLERARELAARHSPVLRAARAAVDASLGDLTVAQSGFQPTFQGNYAYQAFSSDVGFVGNRGRFPVLPVRGFGPGVQNFHVSEVQMKWSIFQFGRLLSKERQALFRTEVSRLEVERTAQSVDYQVARTYFQVLEAESAREITDRAVEGAEAYAREAVDLLRRGSITREQQLRLEAELATVRQAQADARSEAEVAVAALNQTMGINVNAATRVAERRAAPRVDVELKQALELSVANRREIPVVLRGIAIAREGVDFARAEFLPSVAVQAGYSNVTGTGVQNANVGAGGIFLTQDLYAGGKRRGQLRTAEANVRSAEAQAQQVCDLIAFEVNEAYRSFEDARSRIGAARAVYLQAAENLRLVGSRYRAGDATPAEVVDARASETKSEQTFNSAFYQYQRAIAGLEYAVGASLPVSAETLPGAAPFEAGPDPVPAPPPGESPFRARPDAGMPGLTGAPSFSLPSTGSPPPPPSPTLTPGAPQPPTQPGLFGPPSSLSRPPYESNSPFGTRP